VLPATLAWLAAGIEARNPAPYGLITGLKILRAQIEAIARNAAQKIKKKLGSPFAVNLAISILKIYFTKRIAFCSSAMLLL
jgi:hypothetical protein